MCENPWYVRADISGFFDGIPRDKVKEKISLYVNDGPFLELLDRATSVTLQNEEALGEDRKLFPTDSDGVAQGSPLSPLLGNILLYDFDREFNQRGIQCFRFIDDFIIFGRSDRNVRRAFEHAKEHLRSFGLKCHDPFDPNTPAEKATAGNVKSGFVFLGYHILPGQLQPSDKARKSIIAKLTKIVESGKLGIQGALNEENSYACRQRYVQTLDRMDRVIRGWGDAFAYTNARDTLTDLDRKIDGQIKNFDTWYMKKARGVSDRQKRRALGVGLLFDSPVKSLRELPFRVAKSASFRKTKNTIIVSTDGSLHRKAAREGLRDVGGWAAIFHDQDREISGSAQDTTNNEMELEAVVEALKSTAEGASVIIRTDSRYVFNVARGEGLVRSNFEQWRLLEQLVASRRVRLEWVRGHTGDSYNERADQLAQAEADRASKAHGRK